MKAILTLVLWIVFVTYMSLSPIDPEIINLFKHSDKVGHFIFYLVMAFLALSAFTHRWKFKYVSALLLSICYGILMENLQEALKGGRIFDYFDIIANIIGAFTGALLFYIKEKSNS